jgi:hypothetical protein
MSICVVKLRVTEKCSHMFRTLRAVSRDTQSGCCPAAGIEKCSHLFIGLCSPFRVTRNPDVGRQLAATRRITAGEILCQEEPLIVGPNQVTTETVFSNCYGAQESIPRGTDSASLCSSLAGRYENNPIPTRLLGP